MRFLLVSFSSLILLIAFPGVADAGIKLYDRYLGIVGGYDSNVLRLSSEYLEPGESITGDVRILAFGSLELGLEDKRLLDLNLRVKPYYIKYQDNEVSNRGDLFLGGNANRKLAEKFYLNVSDRYRFTFYPNREGRDQLYNSARVKLSYYHSWRWKFALHYRNLFRDNPRRNLLKSRANGVAVSVKFQLFRAVDLGLLAQRDFEEVEFVFPRTVSGSRSWVDISIRYVMSSDVLLMGKYMYQRDGMDIVFLPGEDLEELHESGEEIADGILQSLRFLEDTYYNFHKHLSILAGVYRVGSGTLLDLFLLYQKRYLSERILEVPSHPLRIDRTFIAQASLQARMTANSHFVFYVRFEENDTNDPDHDHSITTYGLGVKASIR